VNEMDEMDEIGKTVKFLEKENDYNNETTRYWFNIDGVNYCLADQYVEIQLLDSEGYPIDPYNDHENILDTLKTLLRRLPQ
jgi:hypothetical protein